MERFLEGPDRGCPQRTGECGMCAHDTVQGVDCCAANCALLTMMCALDQLEGSAQTGSGDDWEYVPSLVSHAKV